MLIGIDLEHVLEDTEAPAPDAAAPPQADALGPNYLTPEQMGRLDAAFGAWVAKAKGKRSVISRNRARLVFLLLRYTGGKLGEILAINDQTDFVLSCCKVLLGGGRAEDAKPRREVYLPGELHAELKQLLRDPDYASLRGGIFRLDQGYMRRIIYERAGECGVPKHLANPNMLRRSRAVELLHNGVPLTVVQRILGHLTANSTASFLDLPEEDQKRMEKYFLDRENRRAVSSHNTFFGKVAAVAPGDGGQTRVVVTTLGGHALVSTMSAETLKSMELREGSLVTARVKAARLADEAQASAKDGPENRFRGTIERILRGEDDAEVVLVLSDGSRLNVTAGLDLVDGMGLGVGNGVWAVASAAAVLLSVG